MNPKKKRKLPFRVSSKMSRFAGVGKGSSLPKSSNDSPTFAGASSSVAVTATSEADGTLPCLVDSAKVEVDRSLQAVRSSDSDVFPSPDGKACSVPETPSHVAAEFVLSKKGETFKRLEPFIDGASSVQSSYDSGATAEESVTPVSAGFVDTSTEKVPSLNPSAKSYANLLKASAELEEIGTPAEHVSGVPLVFIPDDNIAAAKEEFKDFIFARFQGDVPSMGRIIRVVNSIWANPSPRIFVHKIGLSGFLLKVANTRTRERILARTCWNIAGHPMFVAPWSPELDPEVAPLTMAVVPVELRNVPYLLFNKESLSRLATAVGKPVSLAPGTERKENFHVVKMYVRIDLTRKLPEKIISGFSSGREVEISVTYPWLPVKCELCSSYGHVSDKCRSGGVVSGSQEARAKSATADKSRGRPHNRHRSSQSRSTGVTEQSNPCMGGSMPIITQDEIPKAAEPKQEVQQVASSVALRTLHNRNRSRARSRSRSIVRVYARAVSSPPEVSKSSALAVVRKQEVLTQSQLEEGEIGEDDSLERNMSSNASKEFRVEQDEEDEVWFTKHSKNYRRALRQQESWEASGAVGSPPKSAKFLMRANTSGGKIGY